MSLIMMALVGLIVFFTLFWLVNTYAPTTPPVRTIANIVLIIVVIVWGLGLLGILPMNGLDLRR